MLPALVVGPKRVVEVAWPEELATWRPDLTYAVAAGSPAKREAALRADVDVVLLGRDNLAKVASASRFRTVILDESSSYKSVSSSRFRAARKLFKETEWIWALTGTPAAERLSDIWTQVFLLDRGQRLETAKGRFLTRYFVPEPAPWNHGIRYDKLKDGAAEKIYSKISDIALSMSTEGRVDLPEVTHNWITVPLPSKARRAHDQMKADLFAEGVFAANSAVAVNKLRQVTAGKMYDDDRSLVDLHSAKMDVVAELLDTAVSPTLVFYDFVWQRDLLRDRFGAETVLDADRWNAGKVDVLAVHPASAGHGLNLQKGGHTIIWPSPIWSLELTLQANKRLHRSGQRNTVTINYLVAPKSVDMLVKAKLEGKKNMQDEMLRFLERE